MTDSFIFCSFKAGNGIKWVTEWGYPTVDVADPTLTFGARIGILRIKKGFKQADLAAASGLAVSVIGRYEQDRILDIHPEVLKSIAAALQVDPALLIPPRIQSESGEFASFFSPGISEGSKIKQFRIDRGIRQKDLAESLGVARETIRRYENGTSTPTKRILEKLEELMNLF